jgi:hypothetical protein
LRVEGNGQGRGRHSLGRAAIILLLLGPLLLRPAAVPSAAALGGEFMELEGYVGRHPQDPGARLRLADAYELRGFVEEAVAQYLAALKLDRDDEQASSRLTRLVQRQMPAWLPAGAEAPFARAALHLSESEEAGPPRLLLTTAVAAPEDGRRDHLHGWLYPWVVYGYLWDEPQQRWLLTARAHYATDGELAQASLQTVLTLSWIVPRRLRMPPARGTRPLDIWLAEQGEPGARTVGRDIFVYGIGVDRTPEEWLREVAHEFGHAALPGLGGFTKTDDPWADGEVGELLFVKWLAAARPEQFPWPIPTAEALARPTRDRLMARARKPDPKLLTGAGAAARDHLVGLVLRVDAAAGPQFLGEVLSRCPHGSATQFVRAAERLAKERGVRLW